MNLIDTDTRQINVYVCVCVCVTQEGSLLFTFYLVRKHRGINVESPSYLLISLVHSCDRFDLIDASTEFHPPIATPTVVDGDYLFGQRS